MRPKTADLLKLKAGLALDGEPRWPYVAELREIAPLLLDEVINSRAMKTFDMLTDERQIALEILGRAIARIMPDFRASGDVIEHATAVANELVHRFEDILDDGQEDWEKRVEVLTVERDAWRTTAEKLREFIELHDYLEKTEGPK